MPINTHIHNHKCLQEKSLIWFRSCFRFYREFSNISLPITFNLVQKCIELIRRALGFEILCVYDISKNIMAKVFAT